MKKLFLKKDLTSGIQCIDIFDISIKPDAKRISTVFCDGEIYFYGPTYPPILKQINVISENFSLFYDNISNGL